MSITDAPGNALFITKSTTDSDWRSGHNVNLWQGVDGINNPCPSGYRIPTETELNAERALFSSQNSAGAFASVLKLTMGGRRSSLVGTVGGNSTGGYYWTSTVLGIQSRGLVFHSSNAFIITSDRADGYTVRCIKD